MCFQIVTKKAAKHLRPGEILFWDRLGRSGRAKNPKAQHYNPKCRAAIERAGATVRMLPPKGHLWNPIELLNNDLKEHHIRPYYGKRKSELSKRVLMKIIRNYMENYAPSRLPGFFGARAKGQWAIKQGLLQ